MEKTTQHIDSFIREAGDYLENKKELLKLKALNKTSDVISSVASGLALVMIGIIIFILINIGVALWIGETIDKLYLGFLIVGGFYILIAFIIYKFRRKWLKAPVSNMIIRKLLK